MTDETALAIVLFAAIAPMLLAWACSRYVNRHRANRRVKGRLPPPSSHCQRAPDWRAHTATGRFW